MSGMVMIDNECSFLESWFADVWIEESVFEGLASGEEKEFIRVFDKSNLIVNGLNFTGFEQTNNLSLIVSVGSNLEFNDANFDEIGTLIIQTESSEVMINASSFKNSVKGISLYDSECEI